MNPNLKALQAAVVTGDLLERSDCMIKVVGAESKLAILKQIRVGRSQRLAFAGKKSVNHRTCAQV